MCSFQVTTENKTKTTKEQKIKRTVGELISDGEKFLSWEELFSKHVVNVKVSINLKKKISTSL